MKTDSVVGVNGPEPYNKYTRQGAQKGEPCAFFCNSCNFLDDHGVSPAKVLRKASLNPHAPCRSCSQRPLRAGARSERAPFHTGGYPPRR